MRETQLSHSFHIINSVFTLAGDTSRSGDPGPIILPRLSFCVSIECK